LEGCPFHKKFKEMKGDLAEQKEASKLQCKL
jgi:hypothetical protein